MIISTQLFLQKPLCLSWTKNRMFLSQIQISEQFPGNLSCCQKLGGGVGGRLWSFFRRRASRRKWAKEEGSFIVDGYQSLLVSAWAFDVLIIFSLMPFFSLNSQNTKIYAGMGSMTVMGAGNLGETRRTKRQNHQLHANTLHFKLVGKQLAW